MQRVPVVPWSIAATYSRIASAILPSRLNRLVIVSFTVKRYEPTRDSVLSIEGGSLQELFRDRDVPRFHAFERVARRKLLLLHAARSLQDRRVPPGNRLEELRGGRKCQHSIRINDQWRVCFVWRGVDAFDVEIVDYHGEKK